MATLGYASGKYAIAICDRCGAKRPHNSLVLEQETSLRVCSPCLDVIPSNTKWRGPDDRVSLRWARPEMPVPEDE